MVGTTGMPPGLSAAYNYMAVWTTVSWMTKAEREAWSKLVCGSFPFNCTHAFFESARQHCMDTRAKGLVTVAAAAAAAAGAAPPAEAAAPPFFPFEELSEEDMVDAVGGAVVGSDPVPPLVLGGEREPAAAPLPGRSGGCGAGRPPVGHRAPRRACWGGRSAVAVDRDLSSDAQEVERNRERARTRAAADAAVLRGPPSWRRVRAGAGSARPAKATRP